MTSQWIRAAERWNDSGIHVEEGRHYDIIVPSGQKWCHGSGWLSPKGEKAYYLALVAPFRRKMTARWCSLVGTIDQKDAFTIGNGLTNWTAPASGEIWAYANDVSFAYFNNTGMVRFIVVPLEER